jgi:hypothetical protein
MFSRGQSLMVKLPIDIPVSAPQYISFGMLSQGHKKKRFLTWVEGMSNFG